MLLTLLGLLGSPRPALVELHSVTALLLDSPPRKRVSELSYTTPSSQGVAHTQAPSLTTFGLLRH